MHSVFFYEAFEEEAEGLRRNLPQGLSAGFTSRTIQEEPSGPPPARIISIRTQSVIPPSWAGAMDGLLTRSTGHDHVASYRARNRPTLPCGYLPKYCARAVAEQAMLLWLALLRALPEQVKAFGTFHRDGLTGRESLGKKLLVVGVGGIGIEIVRLGEALGMEVAGVDLVQRHSGVRYVGIEEGLRQAEIVVCSMNLTPDNAGYFNLERFRQGNRGAVFVNVARGELSPSRDLLAALDEGCLSAAGLDVYNHESELAVSLRRGGTSVDDEVQAVLQLARRTNVILTPHNAFNTREAVERKAVQSIEQISHFLELGTFLWPVPTPEITPCPPTQSI